MTDKLNAAPDFGPPPEETAAYYEAEIQRLTAWMRKIVARGRDAADTPDARASDMTDWAVSALHRDPAP